MRVEFFHLQRMEVNEGTSRSRARTPTSSQSRSSQGAALLWVAAMDLLDALWHAYASSCPVSCTAQAPAETCLSLAVETASNLP